MIFTPVGETPEYVVLRMEQAIFMCLFAAEHTHTHTHTDTLKKHTDTPHTTVPTDTPHSHRYRGCPAFLAMF